MAPSLSPIFVFCNWQQTSTIIASYLNSLVFLVLSWSDEFSRKVRPGILEGTVNQTFIITVKQCLVHVLYDAFQGIHTLESISRMRDQVAGVPFLSEVNQDQEP